jgi:hypothetical protein
MASRARGSSSNPALTTTNRKALFIMAESQNTTDPNYFLAVSFWHDGKVEATMVVRGAEAALTAALAILATREALYDGDQLTIDGTVRPNLIQRRLG